MVGKFLRALAAFQLRLDLTALASAQTVRVRGTVERIDGPVFVVKARDTLGTEADRDRRCSCLW